MTTFPQPSPDAVTEGHSRPELLADPYPKYARVREDGRVHFSPTRRHPFLVRRLQHLVAQVGLGPDPNVLLHHRVLGADRRGDRRGVRTASESDDPELVAHLQAHVTAMYQQLEQRLGSPA